MLEHSSSKRSADSLVRRACRAPVRDARTQRHSKAEIVSRSSPWVQKNRQATFKHVCQLEASLHERRGVSRVKSAGAIPISGTLSGKVAPSSLRNDVISAQAFPISSSRHCSNCLCAVSSRSLKSSRKARDGSEPGKLVVWQSPLSRDGACRLCTISRAIQWKSFLVKLP